VSKLAVAFDLPQTEPVATELPGNPLATELAAQMAGLGISVSDVDMHEGYGWAWLATCEDATHYIVLAPFRDGEPGLWLLRFEPQFGLAARLKAARYRAAEAKLKEIIDRLLRATSGVTNVEWD